MSDSFDTAFDKISLAEARESLRTDPKRYKMVPPDIFRPSFKGVRREDLLCEMDQWRGNVVPATPAVWDRKKEMVLGQLFTDFYKDLPKPEKEAYEQNEKAAARILQGNTLLMSGLLQPHVPDPRKNFLQVFLNWAYKEPIALRAILNVDLQTLRTRAETQGLIAGIRLCEEDSDYLSRIAMVYLYMMDCYGRIDNDQCKIREDLRELGVFVELPATEDV